MKTKKRAWSRGMVGFGLLCCLISAIAISPWTKAGAAGGAGAALPAPVKFRHTALGEVRVYNRAAVLALPGVRVRTVKIQTPYSKTRVTPYALAHQNASGDHTLAVGAFLVLVYLFGNFFCGFGVALSAANPIWAYADELGFLYVDGTLIDNTESSGFSSTVDETGCDNPGAPRGAYWKMHTEAGAIWFDGTVINGDTATYQIQ